VLGDRIATLRVRHAVSHRFVMFGADGVGIRFEPCSFVFQAGRCPEIDNVITAALCRPIETSSEVDDNKRARHRQPCRQRNGTKPKFFNDFSRARARRHASARARRCPFGVCPVKRWIGALTEVGLLLLALAIVAALLVGANLPFFGDVVTNIMALVKSLGDAGLVGLIALAIIIWLFSGREIAGPSAAEMPSPTEEK